MRKTISQITKQKAPKEKTKIQEIREEFHLGIREVCHHAGISPATLCRIEGGKAPDIRTAFKLAHFFETTIEVLFSKFGE